MKYLLIFLLFSSCLFAQNKNFRPTYIFEGNLKNDKTELKIKMNFLILLDSSIVGSYYYNPKNGRLNLAGKLNNDNTFVLSEWNENKNTGIFKGKISKNKKKLIGTWKSSKGELFNFNLSQAKDETYWSVIKKNRSLFEYTTFEKIKNEPNKVLSIDMGNQGLNSLPNFFSNLNKIQSINLLGNQFQEFPKVLTQLETLDEISLSTNKLKNIPSEIKNLINLKILILNNNQLKELPKEIGKLTEIKYLELGNNYLSKLPIEMKYLIKLEEMHLERNDFSEQEKERIKKMLPNCVIHF